MLLAITNAVFVGGVAHAYPLWWTDFGTSNWSGTSYNVVKNNSYWEITLTGATTGGVTIGEPFANPGYHPTNVSPWTITYEVVSASGGTCTLRPTTGSTNGLTGSTGRDFTAASSTQTTSFSWSSYTGTTMHGFSWYRTSGTPTCVIRVYEIRNALNQTLWSPTQNSDILTAVLNVTTSTSSGGGTIPSEIDVNLVNDQLWNFLLLTVLFFGTILFIIVILRPLYVRK